MPGTRFSGAATAARATALVALLATAVPLGAQGFRIAGGVSRPRAGTAASDIGGQAQASMELASRASGFGLRVDVLYSQSAAQALSLGDLVFGGRAVRTMAAAGGLFYRREMRDFSPYLLGGGGAYRQTGMAGVALGVHGGIGVDYGGSRWRPFVEARMHRWRGASTAVTVQERERSLVSALIGLRF